MEQGHRIRSSLLTHAGASKNIRPGCASRLPASQQGLSSARNHTSPDSQVEMGWERSRPHLTEEGTEVRRDRHQPEEVPLLSGKVITESQVCVSLSTDSPGQAKSWATGPLKRRLRGQRDDSVSKVLANMRLEFNPQHPLMS